MPGPLDEIVLFPVRQQQAAAAKIHQQRLTEVRSILRRLDSCCKKHDFRWPEDRDLNRLHVLVLELIRRIRKRPLLPRWKYYKAVDDHWHFRLCKTLSALVDRAATNTPQRPLEKYDPELTSGLPSEVTKRFFQYYDEVVKGRDPSDIKWEQFDELLSSMTGKTISRLIPLTKPTLHLELLKLFCADQQWTRKHWRSARSLTAWVATTLQHPGLMTKLRRFLIPSYIGDLMIRDVANIPGRLLEEKKGAKRARDRKRKRRTAS